MKDINFMYTLGVVHEVFPLYTFSFTGLCSVDGTKKCFLHYKLVNKAIEHFIHDAHFIPIYEKDYK